MFKNKAFTVLLFVFVANFFYDDGTQFLYKRIIYSLFIYLAVYEIVLFHTKAVVYKNMLAMPISYRLYIPFLVVFIIIALVADLQNPGFKLITLVNNPYALLSIMPLFIFSVGANTEDLKHIYKLLLIISFIFFCTWFIKLPGSVPYYQGFIASHAVLPFFIISLVNKKWLPLAILLVLLVIAFGLLSNYRISILSIMSFFGLFIPLNLVKNSAILKILFMLIACLVIYLLLANLELVLHFFSGIFGKTFDVDDTRSFLYDEFFSDFKKSELVFGRGFLGTYFSYYFLQLQIHLDDTGDFYQRYGIEVGFLQLLLKGGIVYYTLYVVPLFYVSIKSIFWFKHNKLVFYIGIYIFIQLLLMFFENIPYFSFQFSLLFLLAGYAYSQMLQKQTYSSFQMHTAQFFTPAEHGDLSE